MKYIIKPFAGINNVKFGMKIAEVASAAGLPDDSIDDDIMEEIRETRDNVIFVYEKKKLVEVRFDRHFDFVLNTVMLENGIELNNDEKTVKLLKEDAVSKPSTSVRNCINFYGYGLCFLGYNKKAKNRPDIQLRVFPKEKIKRYERFLNA